MRSWGYLMWDIIVDGPFVPIKKIQVNAELKKIQVNFKAINTLHCALNPMEFNRISTWKIVKEIWDKLRVTHERTPQVKESKIALLLNQYKMFKMQANESITQCFDRYKTIINQLNQLGKILLEDELVKRLLMSLPKTWRSMVVAIREAKDLNKILLDEVCGFLLTYEQEGNQMEEEEK